MADAEGTAHPGLFVTLPFTQQSSKSPLVEPYSIVGHRQNVSGSLLEISIALIYAGCHFLGGIC